MFEWLPKSIDTVHLNYASLLYNKISFSLMKIASYASSASQIIWDLYCWRKSQSVECVDHTSQPYSTATLHSQNHKWWNLGCSYKRLYC